MVHTHRRYILGHKGVWKCDKRLNAETPDQFHLHNMRRYQQLAIFPFEKDVQLLGQQC